MDHIKNLMSKRIRQSGLARQITTALLLEEAENILKQEISPSINQKIKPLYFKNNTLNIVCLSSPLAQEIRLKKPQIIQAINQKIGQEVIKDIRLII